MSLLAKAKAAVKGWLDPIGYSGGGTYAPTRDRGLPSERDALDSSTIVAACLGSVLDAFVDVSPVTATVGPDGEERFDNASAFAAMMLRPDPLRKISGRRLARALVASYELDGNAYADLVADVTGTVREMRWVPWWAVTPVEARGTGLLDHYDLRMADGTLQTRGPDEMLHVAQGIDPKAPLRGASPLRKAFSLVLTDLECDAYCREIVANPAVVGWSVMPKEAIDPTDAELVEKKIMSKFGRGGRGGVMVPHFPSQISALGFSPQDLAIDKMRLTPEARIAGIMNVPAIIAGLEVGLDASTYSNMEQARRIFARYKMRPLWDVFAEEVGAQVLPRCEGYAPGQRAAYDTRRVSDLQEDQDALAKRVALLFEGNVVKRSEARSILGLRSGAGDDVYFADVAAPAVSKGLEQTKNRLEDRRRQVAALRQTDAQDAA